jgi:4-amino-4-deoxy-L-arabinose transferase-like glycosyltransferase
LRPIPHIPLLLLALACTLLNAVKPLTIDDTAYHSYAAQVADKPLDPYGFAVYWWDRPEPANEVLAPPLFFYWWALALRLFGENVFLAKTALLPFTALLAYALYALARRFARGMELPLVALVLFSPTILPSLNMMLDVPAAALGLAAVALFARACDRQSYVLAALAGLVAGLGMETKYTVFLAPAAMLLYAVCLGRLRLWPAAAVVAAQVFLSWEFLMAMLYGESHFLLHARYSGDRGLRWSLLLPLMTNLGSVGWAGVLLALAGLGIRRWGLAAAGCAGLLGYAAVACLGGELKLNENLFGETDKPVLVPFEQIVFGTLGAVGLLVGAVAVWCLVRPVATVRRWVERVAAWSEDRAESLWQAVSPPRPYRVTAFLLLWLALEVLGYLALTPFPAVRRLLAVVVVTTLLLGRLTALRCRTARARRTIAGVAAYGALLGLLVYGVDLVEARTEKQAVAEAVRQIRAIDDQGTIWFVGHWGFQYYAERAGLRPISAADPPADSPVPIPPRSELRRGDWLVLPRYRWSGDRFAGGVHKQDYTPDPDLTRPEFIIRLTDFVPLQTIINFYSGFTAVEHHEGPRLELEVRRVVADHPAEPYVTPRHRAPASAASGTRPPGG